MVANARRKTARLWKSDASRSTIHRAREHHVFHTLFLAGDVADGGLLRCRRKVHIHGFLNVQRHEDVQTGRERGSQAETFQQHNRSGRSLRFSTGRTGPSRVEDLRFVAHRFVDKVNSDPRPGKVVNLVQPGGQVRSTNAGCPMSIRMTAVCSNGRPRKGEAIARCAYENNAEVLKAMRNDHRNSPTRRPVRREPRQPWGDEK